jgi:hypothetical protein
VVGPFPGLVAVCGAWVPYRLGKAGAEGTVGSWFALARRSGGLLSLRRARGPWWWVPPLGAHYSCSVASIVSRRAARIFADLLSAAIAADRQSWPKASELFRGLDGQPPGRPDAFALGMWHWPPRTRPVGSLAMPHVDLGTVPAWLGAGSLLLAFVIFFRDRGNGDRAQVDRLGVWFTETYERRFPGLSQDQDRIDEASVEVHVRNASDLPLEVVRLAYEVRTRWMVPVQPESPVPVHVVTAGNGCVRQFLDGFRVPPGETLSMPSNVNVAHLAPEGAVQLSPIHGVTGAASWLLVTDNVGRRWVIRPREGRAKRRRWYRGPKEYWPREWGPARRFRLGRSQAWQGRARRAIASMRTPRTPT